MKASSVIKLLFILWIVSALIILTGCEGSGATEYEETLPEEAESDSNQNEEHGLITVSYDTEVDGAEIPSVSAKAGEKIILAECKYQNDGMIFAGWSDGETLYSEGNEFTVPESDITLHAVWRVYAVATKIYGFDEMNANGSSWWGTGSLSVMGGGANGGYFSTEAGQSVICGNFVAEGQPLDLSSLEEEENSLSFYIYIENDINADITVDLTSERDTPDKDHSAKWTVSGLSQGWNRATFKLKDATVGESFDISKAQFVHFEISDTSSVWGVDELAVLGYVDAKLHVNNLFMLDSMLGRYGTSMYSTATWGSEGAEVRFSNQSTKLYGSGTISLNVKRGDTVWLYKQFSNTDISKYADDGHLYFWMYVDDASNLTGGQIEITSSTQPDCYDTSWDVASLGIRSGWNEIKLKLVGDAANEDAILSIINYVRFEFTVSEDTVINIEGLYFGTADDIASVTTVRKATSREVRVIENCDTADNWRGDKNITFVSADSEDIEGKGYISASRDQAGDVILSKTYQGMNHWMNAEGSKVNTWRIDLRDYMDSKLVLSLYVSDPSVIAGGQIEFTSSEISDVDEISWGELGVDIPLVAGWNTLELNFADADIIGSPNLSEINFFRVYLNCTGPITVGLDNIYLGDKQEFSDITFVATEMLGDNPQTVTQTLKYKDGARIRMLDIPDIETKEMTNFLGWSDGKGNTYLPGDYVTLKGDAVYTAQYTEKPKAEGVYYAYDLSDGGVSQEGIQISSAGISEIEAAVAGLPNAMSDSAVWMNSNTFGKTLDFSIEGSYAIAGGVDIPMNKDFSVEVWFNAPDRTASSDRALPIRYILGSDAVDICVAPDASLNVNVCGSVITADMAEIGFDIIDERWHHLKVDYTSDGRVTIYIDGKEVKNGKVRADKSLSFDSIFIGAKNAELTDNGNFDGRLARFAITSGDEYYGYESIEIADGEYDVVRAVDLKKGIVMDRRQYWNYNPYVYEGQSIAPNDIQNIKDLGFDHVKILLTPNWLIDDNGELIYENMSYIAPLLDEVKRQDFKCILCLHPEEGFKGTYMSTNALKDGTFAELLNFYQDISAYIVENWGTDFIALQLMTEPNSNSGTVSWDWIADRQWGAARNAAPDLMLITSSDDYGNFERLKVMSPVYDYNLVYSFTTYEPYTIGFNNYTRSSFWPYLKGVLYPVPKDMTQSEINKLIEENISAVPGYLKTEARGALRNYYSGNIDSWRRNFYDTRYNLDWHMQRCASIQEWNQANGGNIYLMAVEFGCSDTKYNQEVRERKVRVEDYGISDETRLTLIDHQTQSFDAYGIGWSYWSYNEYFHILDTSVHAWGYDGVKDRDKNTYEGLSGVSMTPEQFAKYVDRDLIDILIN